MTERAMTSNHALERPENEGGPRLAAARRFVVGRSTSRYMALHGHQAS